LPKTSPAISAWLHQRGVIARPGRDDQRDTFDTLGGSAKLIVVNNDLDYCLRAREMGLVAVFTPHTRLIHYETVSRAGMPDEYDAAVFDGRWRDLFLAGDPFLSPHLTRNQEDFSPDGEPNQVLMAGGSVFQRDEIRKSWWSSSTISATASSRSRRCGACSNVSPTPGLPS
jgi:hypothetical protein